VNDHPLAVDVGDLQVESLLTAKASAVVHGQQCAVLGVRCSIQQDADFFPAPDGRAACAAPWA
jgi:hypothetical protein